jgi:hypothetical protein
MPWKESLWLTLRDLATIRSTGERRRMRMIFRRETMQCFVASGDGRERATKLEEKHTTPHISMVAYAIQTGYGYSCRIMLLYEQVSSPKLIATREGGWNKNSHWN